MADIRNRVKELRTVRYGDLVPNPANWRGHPESQRKAYAGIVDSIGFAGAALARELDDGRLMLIDGHMRRETHPDAELPVLVTDLTEDEANTVLATYDPISAMAEADAAALDSLLRNVNSDNADVQAMLAALAESAGLYQDTPQAGEDAGAQIDRAEELRELWQTERGQLWVIPSKTARGEHRLLCGDSTNADDVGRVMAGERAALLATDPPYNVGFDYGDDVDDEKAEAEYESFSRGWFETWRAVSDRQIVSPGAKNLRLWMMWFNPYHVAPWTKTNAMTNGKVSRWWCWEPVLFFGAKWGRERSNDVFDFPVGQQSGVANHPCPKPLKMWVDILQNYTEKGDIVADAFDGSGTTLVAAEQTGRLARALELEPKFVAVALERMKDMGLEPRLA